MEDVMLKLLGSKTISIILIVLNFGVVNAQNRQVARESEAAALDKLVRLKVEYNKAVYLEEKGRKQDVEKAYDDYVGFLRSIKQEPLKSQIQDYMNKAIKYDADYLKKTFQYYAYIDMTLPMDRSKIISNFDYYRIVSYYIFEKNMDKLPELEDVSIIKTKKWKMPSRDDIRTDQ